MLNSGFNLLAGVRMLFSDNRGMTTRVVNDSNKSFWTSNK